VDHPLIFGAFEVPAYQLDCINMRLLWVGRKTATLVCGVGDVWSGACLEIVEFSDDLPEVEASIVQR